MFSQPIQIVVQRAGIPSKASAHNIHTDNNQNKDMRE